MVCNKSSAIYHFLNKFSFELNFSHCDYPFGLKIRAFKEIDLATIRKIQKKSTFSVKCCLSSKRFLYLCLLKMGRK